MSTIRLCDWCGEEISPGSPFAEVSCDVTGDPADTSSTSGYIGHYHAGIRRNAEGRMGRHCFTDIQDRIKMIHEFSQAALAKAPVATPQKITQLRRKHVKPAETVPQTPGVRVTLEPGAAAAIAGVAADRCGELARLLNDHRNIDPATRRYAGDLAAAADALLTRIPAAAAADLQHDVDTLRATLTGAAGQEAA